MTRYVAAMNSTNSTLVTGTLPPPLGVIPNFVNPESIGYRLITVAAICPAIALTFLSLRIYTKRWILKQFLLDDYSIILAFIFALAYSSFQIHQTKNGAGVHIWDVPAESFRRFMILGTPASTCYYFGTIFIKCSILIFYIRLSSNAAFRYCTWSVMFVSVGYCLTGALSNVFFCHPISRLWDYSIPGTCVQIGQVFLVLAALNAATDVTMLLLPIWLLWPLKLPSRTKIGVIVILMTGSFVCIVSIIRMAEIPHMMEEVDTTWLYLPNLILCMVEMYTGVICACLPILKVFCKHHCPAVFAGEDEVEGPAFSTGPVGGFATHTGLTTSTAASEERGEFCFGPEVKQEEGFEVREREFGAEEEGSSASATASVSASASAFSVNQPEEEHGFSGKEG